MKRKLHSRVYAAYRAGKLAAGVRFRTDYELWAERKFYGVHKSLRCTRAYLAGRRDMSRLLKPAR